MNRILIVDAGSSKTIWSVLDKESGISFRVNSTGINPAHKDDRMIREILKDIKYQIEFWNLQEIHYFGAGCASPILKDNITNIFQQFWPNAQLNIDSDIMGAAIALFGSGKGMVGILGTGSNSCLYERGVILAQTPSLGFILGDEGSGSALGKKLLNGVFKKQLPENIVNKFQDKYHLSVEDVIERVYRQPGSATFLSTFTTFIYENLSEPSIREIVLNAFESFFTKNINPYKIDTETPLGFVGSVAFYFKEVLLETAKKYGFTIRKILKDPMESLENYYLSE